MVLTFNLLYLSAQFIKVAKSPVTLASTVGIASPYTYPVLPSIEIQSNSLYLFPFTVKYFSSSLTKTSPAPETQHVPIPRATTAACEVIPPRAVKIP